MRKILFVLVALLWVVAGIQLVQRFNKEDENKIIQAFNKTNCMDAMSKIQISGTLPDNYKTVEEQTKILEQIAGALGITDDYQVMEERDEEKTIVRLDKKAAKAETLMKIMTVENEVSDYVVESVQFILVEINLYDELDCAIVYKEKLEKKLREYGVEECVELQFSGQLPGRISQKEKETIAEQLLESISAKTRNNYEEGDLYTVYAYTQLVEEYENVGGAPVNVMVGINYNEENNSTNLYLATPFLNEDY